MNECTGYCNQGRLPCNCKGLTTDYGKGERMKFLQDSLIEARWDKYVKWLLIAMIIYFGGHIYHALAAQTVVINTPTGGQTVCIVDGKYISCF
jgi:hypothetical protein